MVQGKSIIAKRRAGWSAATASNGATQGDRSNQERPEFIDRPTAAGSCCWRLCGLAQKTRRDKTHVTRETKNESQTFEGRDWPSRGPVLEYGTYGARPQALRVQFRRVDARQRISGERRTHGAADPGSGRVLRGQTSERECSFPPR